MTWNTGALLLVNVDRAVGRLEWVAARFVDRRDAKLMVHTVAMLLGQRMFDLALDYEDLLDSGALRHDQFVRCWGELQTRRSDALVAGKLRLNRRGEGVRGRRGASITRSITSAPGIEKLLVDLFPDEHKRAWGEIVLEVGASDDPLPGWRREAAFSVAVTTVTAICRYVHCDDHLLVAKLREVDVDASAGAV